MEDEMEYKNPAATATLILEREGKIALVRRKHPPYVGELCLPGGYLNCDKETLERAAQREIMEEARIRVQQKDLCLLCVNSSPTRDPRGHVIDHVYVALRFEGEGKAGDDAAELIWTPLNEIPNLAFDHTNNIKLYKEWKSRRENGR